MSDKLRLELELLALAVRRGTVLPVGPERVSDDFTVRSVRYDPLVAGGVGLCGAVMIWVMGLVLPLTAAVLLGVAVTGGLTRGRAERGFAMAFEGLAAGPSRGAILRVIETGRLGVAGGMALGLAVSLKVVLLSDLSLALAGVAMILGQVLGRMAAVHVAATTIWARSAGMQAHVPSVTSDGYRVALASAVAIMAICAVALGVGTVLCAMLGAIALGQAMRLFMTRWVGGYTSVFLSAARMVAELGVLLGIEIWM